MPSTRRARSAKLAAGRNAGILRVRPVERLWPQGTNDPRRTRIAAVTFVLAGSQITCGAITIQECTMTFDKLLGKP